MKSWFSIVGMGDNAGEKKRGGEAGRWKAETSHHHGNGFRMNRPERDTGEGDVILLLVLLIFGWIPACICIMQGVAPSSRLA